MFRQVLLGPHEAVATSLLVFLRMLRITIPTHTLSFPTSRWDQLARPLVQAAAATQVARPRRPLRLQPHPLEVQAAPTWLSNGANVVVLAGLARPSARVHILARSRMNTTPNVCSEVERRQTRNYHFVYLTAIVGLNEGDAIIVICLRPGVLYRADLARYAC